LDTGRENDEEEVEVELERWRLAVAAAAQRRAAYALLRADLEGRRRWGLLRRHGARRPHEAVLRRTRALAAAQDGRPDPAPT
jgi:hypothetical protein